jgi:hypothetical protein
MNERRCLGRDCSLNIECDWYVRPRTRNDQVFQGYPTGELCDQFEQRGHGWGVGPETEND